MFGCANTRGCIDCSVWLVGESDGFSLFGQASANEFFVVSCKDVFVGKCRVSPADAVALVKLISRRFDQFRTADFLESVRTQLADD